MCCVMSAVSVCGEYSVSVYQIFFFCISDIFLLQRAAAECSSMMNTDPAPGPHPPKSPVQTNVTVMTDTGPNPQSLEIRLNIGYFKTAPGIVKILQLVSRHSPVKFLAPSGA